MSEETPDRLNRTETIAGITYRLRVDDVRPMLQIAEPGQPVEVLHFRSVALAGRAYDGSVSRARAEQTSTPDPVLVLDFGDRLLFA